MSKEVGTLSTTMELAEFRKLLGAPPVLSAESVEAYEAMVSGFMRSLVPQDFVEQILINQINDATWEIQRYQRAKSASIDKRYLQHLAHTQKQQEERAKRKASLAAAQAEVAAETSELDRLYTLEGVVEDTVAEVGRIAEKRPPELDYSGALEAGIEYQERFDRLLNAAFIRRGDTLEQLEIYRNGLGRDARRAAPQVIEGEFKETEPQGGDAQVSLVPKLTDQDR
jgi:hypothetical protein